MKVFGFHLLALLVAISSRNSICSNCTISKSDGGDGKINNYYVSVTQYDCLGSNGVAWSDWGECSVPCGATGITERTAPCTGQGTTATCLLIERRQCFHGTCRTCTPVYPLIDGSTYNVSDNALTASFYSKWLGVYHGPDNSRLNDCPSGRRCCAWGGSRIGSWIQVDLGGIFFITKVATQGRGDRLGSQWVTSYKLGFSIEGDSFDYTADMSGNTDKTTVVENAIPGGHVARYVRLVVTGYHGITALRWELYGCPAA